MDRIRIVKNFLDEHPNLIWCTANQCACKGCIQMKNEAKITLSEYIHYLKSRESLLKEEVERLKRELDKVNNDHFAEIKSITEESNKETQRVQELEQQNKEQLELIRQFYYKCDLTRLNQQSIEAVEKLLKQ